MADYPNLTDPNVSTGDWVLTLILSGIPIVGFILLLVWAFGGGAKISKRNYARATLILMIIGFVLGILIWILGLFLTVAAGGTILTRYPPVSPDPAWPCGGSIPYELPDNRCVRAGCFLGGIMLLDRRFRLLRTFLR